MPPTKTGKRGGKNPNNPLTHSFSSNVSQPSPATQPQAKVNSSSMTKRDIPTGVHTDKDAANVCPICAEPVKDWAVGHCTHVICGDCSHRMRVLYGRKACAMCNANLNQVVVVPLRHYRQEMNFEEAVSLPGAFQDKQVDMWFIDRARHQHLRNVRGWKCSHKRCNMKGSQESVFANSNQLRAHARVEHRAIYCEICFTGSKCFASELPLYTLDADRNYSSRLRGHIRKEHPQCKFCREHYLDDEKLYLHLQEVHETCSVCERNGRMHEYYVNFEQLENHYRKEHYICLDEGCRGVVFATQIELQTHEHTRHGDPSRHSRARAFRVNLQQLHGDRDPQRRDVHSPRNVRMEQERQAARRQAFLSSNVIFSGAFNFDDASVATPAEGSNNRSQPQTSLQSANSSSGSASSSRPRGPSSTLPSSAQPRGSSSTSAAPSSSINVASEIRRPDDGHFHPLDLPRDQEELQARNKVLVRTMRSLLDPAAYEQFRMSSGHFHSGKITAEQYYDAATDAFGVRAAVRDILPELVALLPTPLLREPLLRICLQRTDTKLAGMSSFASSVGGLGLSDQGQIQEEQFPSLNGNTAPVRAPPPPVRRFGAPKPEEFPRLNRVNKPQGNVVTANSKSVPASSSNVESSSSSRPSAELSNSTRPASSQSQRTAASVLKEAFKPPVASSQQRANEVTRQTGSSSGVQFSASAFPALGPASRPAAVTPHPSAESASNRPNWADSNGSSADARNPDVSMRVGAVWGGAASRERNQGGKKRGPGRGRRPASPPRHIIQNSDVPSNIRTDGNVEGLPSATEERDGSVSGRQAKVIDVTDIAKSRRNVLQRNNLPKIGGSGYGFAWERKKAQQKRRQIKNDVQHASLNNVIERPAGVGPSMTGSNGTATNLESNSNDADASEKAESTSTLTEGLERLDVQDADSQVESASVEGQDFDPYSYLKESYSQDEAVASFFANTR